MKIFFFILILLTFILFITDLLVGTTEISLEDLYYYFFSNHNIPTRDIIENFRIPRAVTAFLAGASLAVSGLMLQSFFRNPLAGPYVLGISSGAALGVAIVTIAFSDFFNLFPEFLNWSMIISSGIGAMLVFFVIILISFRFNNNLYVLIVGIFIGSAINSVINFLEFIGTEREVKTFIVWTLGSLGAVTQDKLLIYSLIILISLILSFFIIKPLNFLMLGENYALVSGINTRMYRMIIFILTSILTGTTTAFCGPLAFVGVAVPHISRILTNKNDHKYLIPSSIFIGAMIMLISDIITKSFPESFTLPINSVTSLFGIPIVMYVLVKNRKKMFPM